MRKFLQIFLEKLCEIKIKSYLCINKLKQSIMNTDNTLAYISSMISSEESYRTLVDMIGEMDLEFTGITLA